MDKEKVVSELEWFKSELLKGDKILEYYQAQVDILQRAIQLLEQKSGDGLWQNNGNDVLLIKSE